MQRHHIEQHTTAGNDLVVNLDQTDNMSATDDHVYELMSTNTTNPANKTGRCRKPALSTLLMPAPTFFALTDAADIAMSIHRSANKSALTASISGAIAFLSSIGLNFEATRDSFDETLSMIKSRKLPHAWPNASRTQRQEWPKISRGKNIAALILATPPTLVAIVGYTCSAIYVVSPVPNDWKLWEEKNSHYQRLWDIFLTTPAATGSAITCAFTAGTESFKMLRRILAREQSHYFSTTSKWLSILVGGGLGVCDSIQDAVNVFVSIVSVLGLKESRWLYVVSAAATLHLFANFSFSGLFGVNAVDAFYQHIATRQFKLKKIAAFTLALGMSGYLAYMKQPLNRSFYDEVLDDFAPSAANSTSDTPTQDAISSAFVENIFNAFSWLIVGQDTLLGTASVYDPMLKLVNKLLSCCRKPETDDLDFDSEDEQDRHYPEADASEEESLLSSQSSNYSDEEQMSSFSTEANEERTDRYFDALSDLEDDNEVSMQERSGSFYQPSGMTLFSRGIEEATQHRTRTAKRQYCQIL